MLAALLLSAGLAANLAARVQAPAPPVVSAPAPAPTPAVDTSLERLFVKNFLRDQKTIWTSPFKIRPADVKWLAPLGAGTAAFIWTDRRTGDQIAVAGSRWLHGGQVVSRAGTTYALVGTTSAFYLIGWATHSTRARETGLLGAQALLNSAIVASTMKLVTQRSRPNAGDDRGMFFAGGSSFPSGHTIHTWAVASVIAHEYRDHRWVPWLAYGMAGAVGLSRFAAQRHYLSDVLVGSALGYAIGRYTYRAHHRPDSLPGVASESRSARPIFSPRYDRRAGTYGLTVSWIY